jgi:hypothetical protein
MRTRYELLRFSTGGGHDQGKCCRGSEGTVGTGEGGERAVFLLMVSDSRGGEKIHLRQVGFSLWSLK